MQPSLLFRLALTAAILAVAMTAVILWLFRTGLIVLTGKARDRTV